MTTTLRPLPPEAFAAYMQASIASYAQENVEAGRWPAEGALERSHADFLALLPQIDGGLIKAEILVKTIDHWRLDKYLESVLESTAGRSVRVTRMAVSGLYHMAHSKVASHGIK